MDSKGLDVPVSVSNKLEVPNLGCRFSEKAEHLPIKKRRFLFRTPSPPHNTTSSEVNGSVAPCLDSPTPVVRPKPDPSCPPAASFTVADLGCSGSTENKPNGEKFVKGCKKASEQENICGISLAPPGMKDSRIVSIGIKSLKPPGTIKLEPNNVELPKISPFEIGLHLSTIPSKDFASSTTDNSTQVTSEADKSAAMDDRLNWDLNTVMAWEESPECDHTADASCSNLTYANGKNRFKEANIAVCKQERVCENIRDKIITDLRSFSYKINEPLPEPEERKPGRNDIKKLPSSVTPSIVKLEYPTSDISAKHVNHNDLLCRMAAGTGFSLDYSMPPGFDHEKNGKNTRPSEENVNHGITTAVETTENQKLNLSLVTAASPENEVHQSGTSLDEKDDKAQIKKPITATSQDKALNQTNIGSLLVMRSSELPEGEHQPSAVSSVHDADMAVKPEKLSVTGTTYPISHQSNTEVCDFGIEKVQDNVLDEYDSQIEDGEVRESSIQTWEGSEGEDRENEDDTENKNMGSQENDSQCAPESSSRVRSADEISSVVLPEKPDSSEQISGSELNASQSEEWKMNVSESENYTNVAKIRDLSSIKQYRKERIGDPFFNRGRFRMQGYSCSSSNGDDSGPRGVVKSFRRGKYIPTGGRGGGAAFHRHSPPSFLDPNDDVRPGNGPSYVSRRMLANREEDDFRARLGLRPAGEMGHNRFRGRGLRYGSRGGLGSGPGPGQGPRGRYHGAGPAGDDSPPMEYPVRQHHCGSTSPPRSRTLNEGFRQRRSRSPRIRRPNDHVAGGYNNLESPRWVKYRRSPPPANERLSFYESSRKPKPNDNFRSGRFSDIHGGGGGPRYDGDVMENNGYRRGGGGGGFVRRPVKHIEYDEEDGYGGVEGFGPKPYGYGTDTRFRDNLPRRPREERDNW